MKILSRNLTHDCLFSWLVQFVQLGESRKPRRRPSLRRKSSERSICPSSIPMHNIAEDGSERPCNMKREAGFLAHNPEIQRSKISGQSGSSSAGTCWRRCRRSQPTAHDVLRPGCSKTAAYLQVTTLPQRLEVPQVPERRHSSCTIWLWSTKRFTSGP